MHQRVIWLCWPGTRPAQGDRGLLCIQGTGMTDRDLMFEDHMPGLRRYAQVLLGDPAEVDELVQECFMRAFARSRLPEREPILDPRAYLFGIMHNVFIDHTRALRRRRNHDSLAELHYETAIAPTQHSRLEMSDLFWALNELPFDQRQVVVLIGLHGRSYREVAEILQVPVGTIMSRLSRGRSALRQLMSDGHGSGRRSATGSWSAWSGGDLPPPANNSGAKCAAA